LTDQIIPIGVEEAELAKLFTNTWRYIKFAAANQLYMIANDLGLDYGVIRDAMTKDYPRAADVPGPGLTAGPCLLKDTMQLPRSSNHFIGHGMMVARPALYLVARWSGSDLSRHGRILGMAFRAESDDTRSSLSYS
jgi:UDP-N-acetyl-D-mannosaminuronic acid dehydrogenase